MRSIPATALRANLFETLKRVGYEREPILIERRGRPIAALVAPETVRDTVAAPARRPNASRPTIDPKALADFCAKHDIKTLYLFGSVLTDRFGEDSDVDVMFDVAGPSPALFDQMNMADELQEIFGRPVDLVSRTAVERLPNEVRKRAILDSARIIYGR